MILAKQPGILIQGEKLLSKLCFINLVSCKSIGKGITKLETMYHVYSVGTDHVFSDDTLVPILEAMPSKIIENASHSFSEMDPRNT